MDSREGIFVDSREEDNRGSVSKKREACGYIHGEEIVERKRNGHMTLEMAIDALGLKAKGGEVITTPFRFICFDYACHYQK